MGAATGISWTDSTFNAWIGCGHATYVDGNGQTHAHQGCLRCYAESDMADRRGRVVWGAKGTRSVTSYDYWRQPYKWNSAAELAGVRSRVFCSSLADVFEDWQGQLMDSKKQPLWFDPIRDRDCEGLPIWRLFRGDNEDRVPLTLDLVRSELFKMIDETPWLDWQLLTKRPENVLRMCPYRSGSPPPGLDGRFRPNVWIGSSVSDQPSYDSILPMLLLCRGLSPVLFLSAEPLLGAIDMRGSRLDWLIIGGESGSDARHCDVDWIRQIMKCRDGFGAMFVKQLGSVPVHRDSTSSQVWSLTDKKGGDWSEWPEDLRVREFPVSAVSIL